MNTMRPGADDLLTQRRLCRFHEAATGTDAAFPTVERG